MNRIIIKGLLITLVFCVQAAINAHAGHLPKKHEHSELTGENSAIANKERIINTLIKRGEIPASATEAQKEAAYVDYMHNRKRGQYETPEHIKKMELAALQRAKKKGNVTLKAGTVKNVKILAVLVDFPDLPYDDNRLTPSDTNMYYSNYSPQHYAGLIFSPTGYNGPSNQNLTSAYQYYMQESGNTLVMQGQVYGWVTADSNAAIYGGNDPDDDDNDLDVPQLVKEAVTKAVAENSINLADFDAADPYDLDNDGNLDEPDGIVDNVLLFHSSMGEETGGGVLGDDAIWSHRFFVDGSSGGYTVPGTSHKIFGYAVQPIDAAIGVVVHEFGHLLGLPDEYNTNSSEGSEGAPVGYWSVMASGTWTGPISGTEPTGFSPYAKDYLQERYDGSWISTQRFSLDDIQTQSRTINLTEAVQATAPTNLIKIDVPGNAYSPYTDAYQYHSGIGNDREHTLDFSLDVPAGSDITLTMKSHWDIEVDWDYALMRINGAVIAGNHTKVTNEHWPSVTNFITGKSSDIAGAEGDNGWVDLAFDLSSYAGSTVQVSLLYKTDQSVGGYGLYVDDIQLVVDSSQTYFDGAEYTPPLATLDGFEQVGNDSPGGDRYYYVQMRSLNGVDTGLSTRNYEPGMVVWFGDPEYSSNHSNTHPGFGFIGVVDANQTHQIGASTNTLIHDAAFSLYSSPAISVFDDSEDYSSPQQPASGLVLPTNGLRIILEEQATDSSTATVRLEVVASNWNSDFAFSRNFRTVTFENNSVGTGENEVLWDFGDGNTSTEWEPTHTYSASGSYDVTLSVTTLSDNTTATSSQTIVIADALDTDFTATDDNGMVSLSVTSTGGAAPITYTWNMGDNAEFSTTDTTSVHEYSASGTYTVTLTVTSDDQQTLVIVKDVEVYILPVAAFSVSTNNLTATLTNETTGGDGNLTYSWDFGDGGTSSDTNPTHTYTSAGSYTVALSVTDGRNSTSSLSRTVTVTAPPSPPPSNGDGGGGGGSAGLGMLLLLMSLCVQRLFRFKGKS